MADWLIDDAAATARVRKMPAIDAEGCPHSDLPPVNKAIDSPRFADSLIFRLNS
jgi:hypothetical protein